MCSKLSCSQYLVMPSVLYIGSCVQVVDEGKESCICHLVKLYSYAANATI